MNKERIETIALEVADGMGKFYDEQDAIGYDFSPLSLREFATRFLARIDAERGKGGVEVASIVPCHTPSGKRVALHTEYQHLPIGTPLFLAADANSRRQAERIAELERSTVMTAMRDAIKSAALEENELQAKLIAAQAAALAKAREALKFYANPHVAGQPKTAKEALAAIDALGQPEGKKGAT